MKYTKIGGKGAFDSASVVIISMVSMMLVLMTFTIITSFDGSQDSFSATPELTASVENYKKDYESQMTLAALISNDTWRNHTGFYFASQTRDDRFSVGPTRDDLKEDSIIPTAEDLLEGQSSVYKLRINDNDPLIEGDTPENGISTASSEIRLASPSEEQFKITLRVGDRREVTMPWR